MSLIACMHNLIKLRKLPHDDEHVDIQTYIHTYMYKVYSACNAATVYGIWDVNDEPYIR